MACLDLFPINSFLFPAIHVIMDKYEEWSDTMKYKRIVFKVGTSSLTNEDGSLSRSKVKAITQQLAMLHEDGHELILVSSGAIAAGFGALGFKKTSD